MKRQWIIKPRSRLSKSQLTELFAAIEKRNDLRQHIKETLSNEALAEKFSVNLSTIERAIRNHKG